MRLTIPYKEIAGEFFKINKKPPSDQKAQVCDARDDENRKQKVGTKKEKWNQSPPIKAACYLVGNSSDNSTFNAAAIFTIV